MTNATENRAKEQARAQLDSIMVTVKRLEHAQSRHCRDDDEDCKLTDEAIIEGIGYCPDKSGQGMVISGGDREQSRQCRDDEEQAREAIQDDLLSVEVRSGWHIPGQDEGPAEYNILLCTGGPACRIIGGLDSYAQPESAKLQYQDWFTPWEDYTEASTEESEALLTYAQQFYFEG